jgi:hypothetical protein
MKQLEKRITQLENMTTEENPQCQVIIYDPKNPGQVHNIHPEAEVVFFIPDNGRDPL